MMFEGISAEELAAMLPTKFNVKYENGKLYPYKGAIFSLTYECNTDICEYCYARHQRILGTMKPEQFANMLTWISEITDFRRIHFLGGEPTTIPHLKEYYDIALQFNFNIILYTNGKYSPAIGELLRTHPASECIVFHYEPLHFERFEGFKEMFLNNINNLYGSKDLGIIYMIHQTDFEYAELLDIAQNYDMQVRWMIATVIPGYVNYLTLDQLKSMRPKLQHFLRQTLDRKLRSIVDMAVPLCIFDEDFVLQHGQELKLIKMCSPFVYVKPDLSTQYCSQIAKYRSPPLKSTEDLRNVIVSNRKHLLEIRKKIPFKECESCRLYNLICQGGCHDYKFYL
jgi:radical SAM protein with 4Fe4S-binding SPASM domain